MLYIRNAQEQNFLEEIQALKEGEHTKISSKLLKLNPFLDNNGVLRMNSRLENHQTYPDQIRRPVILPKETRITELIILQIHNSNAHGGPEVCLRETKLRYWLMGGRREIRRCLKNCFHLYDG